MEHQKKLDLLSNTGFRHLPVIDTKGRIVNVVYLKDPPKSLRKENRVVLMVGGKGSRLRPLTDDCPKPMLNVGNKPLLETILENFIEYGFYKFFLSVNYKSEMIEDYFGDGAKWDVNIQYLRENESLGTAGALSLLPEKPKLPLIVMNGDLLTKINFQQLMEFHDEQEANATMCVRKYDLQVPYGVVTMDLENQEIRKISEKPVHSFFVNAGVYVLQPEMLSFIPDQKYYDMPSLFEHLIEKKYVTGAFPIHEYWLDIGQRDDLIRANGEYNN
jgi:NDP-sugar pyrophosphorylase family protein